MCSLPGIVESTYNTCYRGERPTLPYIKHKTLPCMHPTGSVAASRRTEAEVQQRHFALKSATVPVPHPPKLSAPAEPRPASGIKFSLATKYRPKKSVASKTTLEHKADMVRLIGQRYETGPEDWQDAVLWDRLQSRYPTIARPRSPCKDNLLRGSQVGHCLPLDQDRQNKIRKLVQTDELANVFVRKCPGYAGYNPLCPPETRLNDKKNPQAMYTAMSTSFRKLPDELYQTLRYARQGPFSKAITLTYPFNPFK